MPIVARETIKTWFKRLDKPTQEQFWDWMDSYFHKNDLIPQASVDGLAAIIASLPTSGQLAAIDALAPTLINVTGAATFELESGRLLQYIVCTGTGDALIGTSAGGSQLISQHLASGPNTFSFHQYTNIAVTLHFTGTFTALIYTR
jgi:hypothetical protein